MKSKQAEGEIEASVRKNFISGRVYFLLYWRRQSARGDTRLAKKGAYDWNEEKLYFPGIIEAIFDQRD